MDRRRFLGASLAAIVNGCFYDPVRYSTLTVTDISEDDEDDPEFVRYEDVLIDPITGLPKGSRKTAGIKQQTQMLVPYDEVSIDPITGLPKGSRKAAERPARSAPKAKASKSEATEVPGARGTELSSVDEVLLSLIGCPSRVGSGWGDLRKKRRKGKVIGWRPHRGVDIAPYNDKSGCAMFAFEDGIVTHTRESGYAYISGGKRIFIEHDLKKFLPPQVTPRIETRYMHCAEIWVKKGDRVRKGQQIGIVGKTGCSWTINHIHFETHEIENGRSTAVNPKEFVRLYIDPKNNLERYLQKRTSLAGTPYGRIAGK